MFNSRSMIDQTALIGHPPEMRGFDGPGIPPQVHFGARIEAFVTIDAGTSRPTYVGADAWLMKHVHVGHDARIESGCELAPGVVVCGHATIGPDVRIGANATILPYRQVGEGAHIGAGAVVTRDVPVGETWVGNPARKLDDDARDPRPHDARGLAVT